MGMNAYMCSRSCAPTRSATCVTRARARATPAHMPVACGARDRVIRAPAVPTAGAVGIHAAGRVAPAPVLVVGDRFEMAPIHTRSVCAPLSTWACVVVGMTRVVGFHSLRHGSDVGFVAPRVRVLEHRVDADAPITAGRTDVPGPWPALVVGPSLTGLGEKLFGSALLDRRRQRRAVSPGFGVAGSTKVV
jgi:hypothetical protein